jgi:hypothetical protein
VIRPLTCVCLILAAGSGLYLYQVKQRAFALDASLRSTFHDIDVARERTRMLRADWALMNDPERLQSLASQYLTLQPMQPSQLLTMDQLAAALPPPVPSEASPAPAPKPAAVPAPTVDPTHGLPMAEATLPLLPHTNPIAAPVALLQPQPAAPPPAPVPVPQPPDFAVAAPVPQFAPTTPQPQPPLLAAIKPSRHSGHHPAEPTQPWLAEADGYPAIPRRHAAHHAAPRSREYYAANVPPRDAALRITPPAATVMYSPGLGASSGSSLGMASSAALAPPRPLYSTSP